VPMEIGTFRRGIKSRRPHMVGNIPLSYDNKSHSGQSSIARPGIHTGSFGMGMGPRQVRTRAGRCVELLPSPERKRSKESHFVKTGERRIGQQHSAAAEADELTRRTPPKLLPATNGGITWLNGGTGMGLGCFAW